MTEDTSNEGTNEPPWPPPPANRATRRACAKHGHGPLKRVNGITACVGCGAVAQP